ncbi:MAG: DJ-1/PfpI family protein [Haloarculaceae archaeon]|jgi:transcriptional regulator GlxA family with amidase domain
MDLEILLYDGFDELDAIGPYEVFRNGAQEGADLSTRLVTLDPRETVTASHGLRVGVDGTLGSPDVVLVPGGGWGDRAEASAWAEYDRGAIPDALASAHERGATVATVCTGGMLAAGAGILDGRPATTHHVAHDDLREVAAFVDARVVDDGDVLTCGGVTSGLDLAFHVLDREFGTEIRDRVARRMEYEPSEDVYRG